MRIIVCPACEKKLKVPDNVTKTTLPCPACQEPLKLTGPNSGQPKRKRVDDEFDDTDPEDELFEIEDRPRRSGKRSTPRRKTESSSTGIMIAIGGAVLVVMAIAVLLIIRVPNGGAPDAGAANGVAPLQPLANDTNPTSPPGQAEPIATPATTSSNEVAANPVTSAPDSRLVSAPASPATVVPVQSLPTNPAQAEPAPAPPVIAANANSELRYKWESNREYPYKFSIETNLGEVIERTVGVCIYRVSPQPAGPTIEFRQKGTGSAFVVSADGYLVTCAHVVEGAKSLEVHLGDQKYPAQVISTDVVHDVAVIKINAQNLAHIPLSDSNAVQLGQAVRAFGFPLSDVLGNNLKVTAGSVSGLNQVAGSRVFQVDAAINPGNSGGPLVNEFGEVVGVASAKLTGDAISKVAFARPINDAKKLLEQAGSRFLAGADPRQKMEGPALVEKISPAVALVHVTAGASANRTTLSYEATFSTTQRAVPGRPFRLSIPTSGRGSGLLTIDEFGEIVSMTGDEQLPMLMGPVGLIAIAPLNPGGQATWGRKSPTSITRFEQDPNDPLARMRARGIRRPFGPNPDAPKGTVFPAEETTTLSLGPAIANVVPVKKAYELKTLDNAAAPYIHLKGEGNWKFNIKENVPFSAELKFELARNIDNATIRVPFEMQFSYTDPQIIAAERKQAQEQLDLNFKQQALKAAADLDKLPPPKKAKLLRRFGPITATLVHAVQLTPDGQRALVATDRGPVIVFDATQTESIGQLEGLKQNTQLLVVSPDGKRVAAATLGETCVWDLESRQLLWDLQIKGFQPSAIAFSANGQKAYFGFGIHQIQIGDIGAQKMIKEWKPTVGTKAIAISPDGKQLLSTDGKSLFHWDPESGKQLKIDSLPDSSSGYFAARLTLEGGRGVFNKGLSSLDVISFDNPSQATNIPFRPAPNNSFAISANGKRVAVADSSNKRVVVWDAEKNQLIDHFEIDTIAAQNVALSADGKFLLTCGYHKVLQLWEMTE